MELYCGACNEKLTHRPIAKAERNALRSVDGEEALPDDRYVLPDDFDFILTLEVTHIVSTKCLRVVHSSDALRQRGCCGPSMMEEYNQVCPKCSEPVGVIFADCWAPHFTAINADKLLTKPKW